MIKYTLPSILQFSFSIQEGDKTFLFLIANMLLGLWKAHSPEAQGPWYLKINKGCFSLGLKERTLRRGETQKEEQKIHKELLRNGQKKLGNSIS